MPLHDARYQHWQGENLGIWHRRWAITRNGLTGLLQLRWMRHLLTVCWMACVAQAMILFALSQLLVPDSIVVQWLGNLNPQLQALGNGLAAWLALNPRLSIGAAYDLVAYGFATSLQTLTLVALAVAIPHLITRDLASNAIIIYASKALSRFDYLLGKFGTVFGLLTLLWIGPMLVAWFAGNLLSTRWHFFWHSRATLWHELMFLLAGAFVLSLLALGVSAISSRVRVVVGVWVAIWLLGNALVPIAHATGKTWLKFLSLTYGLEQLARSSFALSANLELAKEHLPVIEVFLRGGRHGAPLEILGAPSLMGASVALGAMTALSLVVLWRRTRPE